MFPVNSPENKLDGFSDHMTTDNNAFRKYVYPKKI